MSWLLSAEAGVSALNLVGDVTITSIAVNEILQWNGSAFINRTFAEAGIGGTAVDAGTVDFQALRWDNGNTKWVPTTSTVLRLDDGRGTGTSGQIFMKGSSSIVVGDANVLVDVGASSTVLIAGFETASIGCQINAVFGLTEANHTMEFEMFGSATSGAPHIEIESDGFVHLLNRAWTFSESGMTATKSLDMTGGQLALPNATTTALEDITDAVNTGAAKVEGSVYFDTTANIPMFATGAADNSTWVGEKAGSTITLTPV